MLSGAGVAQAISVMARLGVADYLADGPRTVGEIATYVEAAVDPLYRLLRALADAGIVDELDNRTFALAEMGQLLRRDAASSVRGFAVMVGMPFHRDAWTGLYDAVKTGDLAFEGVHGLPLFDYLDRHASDGAVFDAAMTVSAVPYRACTDVYDFGQFDTIVDVGGGRGQILAAILAANPHPRGVLFDLPDVVREAPSLLAAAGVADRCQVVAGSFFEAVPTGGDAYVLANVVHDWDDASSVRILRCCRRAMSDVARLVLIEGILSDAPGGALSRLADLELMVISPGGRLRDRSDYASLCEQSGFVLEEIVPAGPAAVVTARPIAA
jgi:hypothetical protein